MMGPHDQGLELRVRQTRNLRTVGVLATAVVGMVGMAYASVPLYEIFSWVTGFGGTTQVATGESDRVHDRMVTVRFDANKEEWLTLLRLDSVVATGVFDARGALVGVEASEDAIVRRLWRATVSR